MAKTLDATGPLSPGKVMSMSEIGSPDPIQGVDVDGLVSQDALALEAFMNEYVTIVVHQTDKDGENEVIAPNVNGTNQPMIRGVPITVRRKYVEALARCRTTKYVQQTPDPREPANIQMVEKTVLSYPFSLQEDQNPRGREWLQRILAQP
jgi:hypothetical protein